MGVVQIIPCFNVILLCFLWQQYQSIVDAEWEIIYEKLDNCVKSGAQIILSKLAIGDLATQYFADRNLFCAGRVPDEVCNVSTHCARGVCALQDTVGY